MLRPDHLGLAFRFLRTSRHFRQHQVAEQAGITPSMLSGYENGRKLPTLATLEKILLAMGCSLRDLVGALELVRDGKLAASSWPTPGPTTGSPATEFSESGFSATGFPETVAEAASVAPAAASRPFRAASALAPAFNLEVIFGAGPLAQEEEEAFGEMLGGYCRWLRFLRGQTSACASLERRREGELPG